MINAKDMRKIADQVTDLDKLLIEPIYSLIDERIENEAGKGNYELNDRIENIWPERIVNWAHAVELMDEHYGRLGFRRSDTSPYSSLYSEWDNFLMFFLVKNKGCVSLVVQMQW